jgi:hypothetical protein
LEEKERNLIGINGIFRDFDIKINDLENEIKNYLSIVNDKDNIITLMDSKIQKLEKGINEIEKNNKFLEKEKLLLEEKNNKLNDKLSFLTSEINNEKDENYTKEILIEQVKFLKYNLKEKDIAINEMTLNITKLETTIHEMNIIMNNNNYERAKNISFRICGNEYSNNNSNSNNFNERYLNEFEFENLRKDIENNYIVELREKDELINLLQRKLNDLQEVNKTCYELLGNIEL